VNTQEVNLLISVAGVSSVIGLAALCAAVGFALGLRYERDKVRVRSRMIPKAFWPLEDRGMVCNLSANKVLVPRGPIHMVPEKVTIEYKDHIEVLHGASIVLDSALAGDAMD
jgi:hypothetical protein